MGTVPVVVVGGLEVLRKGVDVSCRDMVEWTRADCWAG